ncbi:FkbM family methyltransferase [Mycolicibacterium aromaticivorans]|uniref:FkbM family methyltransferase n=1 Tax=Mycolicibacterium aromaticivorans TaxID=318425 RepID=UPI0009DE3EA2|nr:FkbM family methyltransferase [Mycolicibacterium aromaticivorans]
MDRLKASLKRVLASISPRAARTAVQYNRSLQSRRRQARAGRLDKSFYYPQQLDCQIPQIGNLYSQFLGNRNHGVFVEIGANDGVFVSNTWGLAARSWRGLMVEPVPELAAACRKNHRGHPDVTVVETAINDGSQNEVSLFLAGGLTTANPEQKREYDTIEWSSYELTGRSLVVPAQTLDRLLENSDIPADFDVLVVDVEGLETAVFAGFTLPKWRPKLMIIELVDIHPEMSATRNADAMLGRSLVAAGYVVVYKDTINTVLVREDIWEIAYSS